MKWQESLKTKNIVFFTLISIIFLLSIMFGFTLIKSKEFPSKAENEVTLSTHEIIRELLIEEQSNEQAVLSMATVAGENSSKTLIQKLLNANKNQEIISGSIWIDNNTAKKREDPLVYHFTRENDSFKEVNSYKEKMSVFYKKMKFYTFGHYLKRGQTFWTKMYFDALSQTKVISVLAPIYKKDTYIGIASLNIKFSLCENTMFTSLINSKEKYFILIDRAGNIVMSSDIITHNNKQTNINTVKIPLLRQLLHKPNKIKNTNAVHKISKENPEINEVEANQIFYELEYKNSRYAKRVKRKITLLEEDPVFLEASVVASYYFPHTGWKMLISIPNHIVFKHANELYKNIVLMIIIFAILTAFMGYLLIKKNIVTPLMSISKQIQEGGTDENIMIHTDTKGEIELVVYKLNARNKALHQAHEREVANEKLLLQQSKMAAMGEMLDAVAHQWKQPLNALSMYTELITMDFDDGRLDKKYMKEFEKDVQRQINHMSDTLNTFRSFFRPDTQMQKLFLSEVVQDVLLLAKDELIKNMIEVTVEEIDSFEVYGSKNELRHLVLNLINNAKDAFEQNYIHERHINIRLFRDKEFKVLEVHDNAGGIPENIIKDIFKAHVTSKAAMKGTGIGLYMSTQIAQKHQAILSVSNKEEGACFRLVFSQVDLIKEEELNENH